MVLDKTNTKLLVFLVLIYLCAVVVAPIVINKTDNPWWILLILPSLLFTNTTWALIHEGIHNNLHSNKSYNNKLSRLLTLTINSNFEVLKFGHLMHHRYNRTDYDLTEAYDTAKLKKTNNKFYYYLFIIKNNVLYYFHITFGLYLAEFIGPFFLLLPKSFIIKKAEKILGKEHGYVQNGKNVLLRKDRLSKIRFDNLINLTWLSLVIYMFSSYVILLLLFILIRAWLISSVDNLPHYGTSLDKITGAYNLKAGSLWQRMILNFNYHRVHHKYPNLAWHLLPERFARDNDNFDVQYCTQYLRQWRGVINKQLL